MVKLGGITDSGALGRVHIIPTTAETAKFLSGITDMNLLSPRAWEQFQSAPSVSVFNPVKLAISLEASVTGTARCDAESV
jgi:hypothetical protein